jgi:hypothetical protein
MSNRLSEITEPPPICAGVQFSVSLSACGTKQSLISVTASCLLLGLERTSIEIYQNGRC